MRDTITTARHRAGSDPDRCEDTHGLYTASNMPGIFTSELGVLLRTKNTRGAFRASGPQDIARRRPVSSAWRRTVRKRTERARDSDG